MEHNLDTKWLTRLLKQQYHNDKPADILGVDVEAAVPKGENYISTVVRVKVRAITACGAKKTLSVIVKLAKTSEESQKVLEGFSPFKIETKMFTTVLQQMEVLMDEFEDKRDTLWAKWYGGVPYNLMVLEDLKESGYVLIDRRNWQSLDHAMLVLRNMGRLHAMSKVLLGRGLISEDDKGHYFAGPDTPVKKALVEGGLHMIVKAMKNKLGAWPAGWEGLADRLDKEKPLLCGKLADLYENYDKKFEILCHGDMWSSNMMFKLMEYTGLPISVKFVDYQVVHVNSFIWDVVHYMQTSIRPSVRRAHKPELMKAYHQSFSDNLNFFKYPGYVPTLDDVISEEKRIAPATLVFLTALMPLTSATTEDAFVLEKMLSENPEEIFNMECFCKEKLVCEISEDIKDFARLRAGLSMALIGPIKYLYR